MGKNERANINPRELLGRARVLLLPAILLIGSGIVLLTPHPQSEMQAGSQAALRRPTGQAQLIGYRQLPESAGGQMCEWVPASASSSLMATLQREQEPGMVMAPGADKQADVQNRKPVRMIKDNYSSYSSVAVDLKNDEVVMTDESLFNILTYNRTENTPPNATMSEPKRMIGGLASWIEFQGGFTVLWS